MVIKREEISKVDLSDVTTGKRLPSVHPGTILRAEFLEPMDISVYELANALKVPHSRVNDIVRGLRAITADTALRLSRYFGTSPELWVNLQAQYDLEIARRTARRRIEREVCPREAA
jgi:addiction module HigA family antidote